MPQRKPHPIPSTSYPAQPCGARDASAAGGLDLLGEVRELTARQDRERAAQAVRLEAFGDGLEFTPANLTAVTLELRTLGAMSAQLMFEVGRRLVWVKENMADDETFGAWLQSSVGFTHRTANNYMAVARRVIAGGPEMAGLFLRGGASKAYALLEFSDDEARELVETGKVGDLSVDDVEVMSAVELRKKIRSLERRGEKGRQQLEAAEDRIADLEIELGRAVDKPNGDFLAQVHTAISALRRLCDEAESIESEDELVAWAGSGEVYRQVMVGLWHECERAVQQAQRIAPRANFRVVPGKGPVRIAGRAKPTDPKLHE